MARRNRDFEAIRSEGGLLPPDLLRRILDPREKLPGANPEDYGLPRGERLNEIITQSWNRLRKHWADFRQDRAKLPETDPGTGLTNERWSLPLLRELGFGTLPTGPGPEINGRSYAISRFSGPTPVHLVGCNLSLDRRAAGVRGAAAANPHGLVQEFLNRSRRGLWGIVSNGLRLRILRDSQALSRQSFLEFDLESIFEGENYSDFVLLWLVAHASRFDPREADRPETCWLEEWTKIAQQEGTRALGELRIGVEKALQVLGEGFTGHPRNAALRDALRTGRLSPADLHGQLLRVIYRLIFLFVAEDRVLPDDGLPLLHPRDGSEAARRARERYAAHYGTARLRELAGRIKGSRHGDLWRQFQLIVRAFSGDPDSEAARTMLALPSLGSMLWNPDATADLNDAELTNHDFLETLRHLAFTRQGKVLRPVDYKNLGAEELGGVYESLLALSPQISADGARFTFAELAESERKISGSYYTPDSLVQCLLDSALDPVVEEAIRGKSGEEAEKAILSLRVCDPAAGSGHFLVGAAHRLARHLARVRALAQGEGEPSTLAYRQALRDVIGRCLYGVDVNPMAAELCRVSLWLEALEPGKPLSFLDHQIRVGNSLLGTTPELIAGGLPDEAFNPIEGDERRICSALKRRNRQEREGQTDMLHQMVAETREEFGSIEKRFRELAAAPDGTLEDVGRKAEQFSRLVVSREYRHAQLVADAWCAAFVWKKAPGATEPITTDTLRRLQGNPTVLAAEQAKEVERLASRYRFFHWHLAFPEVFAQGGFNCVLGNPPWGASIPERSMGLIRWRYSGSRKGTIDTFALFIELCVLLTRFNSTFGLVLPDILLLKNYPGIRLFLLNHTAMVELAHWGQAFDQVSIDVCSLVATRKTPITDHLVRCIPQVVDKNPRSSETNMILQETFKTTKQYRFNLLLSAELHSLINIAKSIGPSMGELFILREGVHSGNVRAKLFLRNPIGDSCERLIFGRNEISPMILTWTNWYIQLDSRIFDRSAGEYFNLGEPEFHRSRKLIVRRTGDYVLAAVDNQGFFCSNNFFLCVPKPGVSWEQTLYTCAVLNSRFATWFFRAIQPRTGKLFAELKITHLQDIPVPFANDPWALKVGEAIKGWLSEPSVIPDELRRFNQELELRILDKHIELVAALRGAI